MLMFKCSYQVWNDSDISISLEYLRLYQNERILEACDFKKNNMLLNIKTLTLWTCIMLLLKY